MCFRLLLFGCGSERSERNGVRACTPKPSPQARCEGVPYGRPADFACGQTGSSRLIRANPLRHLIGENHLERQFAFSALHSSRSGSAFKPLAKFKRHQRGGCSAPTPPYACGERFGVHEQPPLRSLRSLTLSSNTHS